MNYDDVIGDFARRTRDNLALIEAHARRSPAEAFEVTQLVNSMLGLLVFPQQRYFDRIPETPLDVLEKQGWPRVQVSPQVAASKHYAPCRNLKELVRCLRNGITHCNVEFLANEVDGITGIRLWNHENGDRRRPKNWEAQLSKEDLRGIAFRFTEMLVAGGKQP